ncbi:MAG: carbohydrate binding domain-containing protein [Butyrivibrio sp.]|nr:carbohydrate binding domain-containing protein [Butyrivibrio sp.]
MEKSINKGMFGLFFEDINYGLDGGLHAEMLENRSFEFVEGRGYKCHYHQEPAYMYGWNAFTDGSIKLSISDAEPLNQVNPHYLCAEGETNSSFCNKAYDGIFLKKGHSANISFYAKTNSKNTVSISIYSKDKKSELISSNIIIIDSSDWKKYETTISTNDDIEEGIFVVTLCTQGEVCFDQFRMYPDDAVLGLFRKDLVDLLKDLRPGFMRFPGGCIVEGNELTNRYQWKKTIGPSEERKSNWNRWAVHGNDDGQKDIGKFPYYNQTLGIGFYEYFLLCEYLGCEPLPVMNVGLACQYQSDQLVASDSPEFEEYVKDALDLIEFANGSIDTTWGKKRAEMGHKEPFNLKLIGIGNEQWETDKVDFFKRYERFEKEIHDRYPEIKCCGSAGPDVTSQHYTDAWNHFDHKMKANPDYSYAVDEHYYVSDEWMYKNVHMYDNYDKHKKVFAGEYACHINPEEVPERRNSYGAALAEAAFMTGLEKNCDVVLMASYAPLFARLGYVQWQPDLIWFDAKKAYGTPSYYVQKLYSCFTGDTELEIPSDIADLEKDKVYVCASKSADKTFIKVINAGDNDISVNLAKINAVNKLDKMTYEIWKMEGNPSDCNSVSEPEKISLKKTSDTSDFSDAKLFTAKAKTISVLVF